MKLIIFGTTWVVLAVVAYLWFGLWLGNEFGGDSATTWFLLGLIPSGIVGAAPFVLYAITEDAT